MRFVETPIPGAFVIELEPVHDDRGFFARAWCETEFRSRGLTTKLAQSGIAFNRCKGTLRGLHYQKAPFREGKLVRCLSGSLFDVIVDLRPDSPAFLRHVAVELSSTNRRTLYVPEGTGHGYQTLEDQVEVMYWMSEHYTSASATGIRWSDPTLNVHWPLPVSFISGRDSNLPLLEESLTHDLRIPR
jgi:dTDP-4-dehydrorhamnose 3,5-epimerase